MDIKRLKISFYKLTLLLSLSIHCGLVSASEIIDLGNFRVERFTETDGLVSAETNGIYKDSRGFLWIATFNGISRFDGKKFENFGRRNGLSESNIEIIGEDEAGQFFIRTVTSVYQYTGNGSLPFKKIPTNGKFITAVCAIKTGEILIAYDEEKGIHYVSQNGEYYFLKTTAPIVSIVKDKCNVVYTLDNIGNIYLVTKRGLRYIKTLRPLQPYSNVGVRLHVSSQQKLWSYAANNPFIIGYAQNVLDSIAVPNSTDWWQWYVGADRNVYMASDNGHISQLLQKKWKEIIPKNVVNGSVYNILEDTDGIVWVATSSGLLKITRTIFKNPERQIPYNYFTTESNGKYALKNDSLLYNIPNAIKFYKTLQAQNISSLYLTRTKEVWYATEKDIYYLPYNKNLQKVQTDHTYEGKNALFRFRKVLEDKSGGKWISSFHGIFYKNNDKLNYYFYKEGLTEGAIYSMAIDKDDIFYAAGVNVYGLINKTFINISDQLKLSKEITRICTDNELNIWICQGTETVKKIEFIKGVFKVTDSLKLSINDVPINAQSMVFDNSNNMWICDNKSLYCFLQSKGAYNTQPLVWDEGLSNSPLIFCDDLDNIQILFHPVSGNSIRSYPAKSLIANYKHFAPLINFTGINLFKRQYDWEAAGFIIDLLGMPEDLVLKHNQNFVQFNFAATTNDFSDKIIYKYKLNGYDKDWSPLAETGFAEYTGIPEGRFRFEVMARSRSGVWSEPKIFYFKVKPVWYATWWAIILWILLCISTVGTLILLRWRYYKNKEAFKMLLIEEQLKTLRAQINPHFLQNTFTFLAHELYSLQNNRAVKAIEGLSVYLRNVLKYSDKTTITLEEEIDFADQYLAMQQQLLSTKFTFNIKLEDDVDVFDVQVPSMLLQPILENALKYGISNTKVNHLEISIYKNEDYIICEISDSGANFPKSEHHSYVGAGKGIQLTKDRMNLFFHSKKRKPKISYKPNAVGGRDVMLLIPIE